MTARYDVTGYFYVEQGYPFRSYLHIRRKPTRVDKILKGFRKAPTPDLMVVMMNPGSALPLAGGDDGRAEAAVRPDPTQYQIMKVMDAGKFRFARVLNLSDLRSPNSEDFLSSLGLLDQLHIRHSIFGPGREQELERLYDHSVPVILAWGVDNRLVPLARRALTCMHNTVKLGQQKPGSDCMYYHALQRGRPSHIWVDQVVSQL